MIFLLTLKRNTLKLSYINSAQHKSTIFNNFEDNWRNSNEKTTVVVENKPVLNQKIVRAMENLDGFDYLQVLHPGKLYFDGNKHCTGFVKRKGKQYTIVEVKIPSGFINFESIKEILYSHLYEKESTSC